MKFENWTFQIILELYELKRIQYGTSSIMYNSLNGSEGIRIIYTPNIMLGTCTFEVSLQMILSLQKMDNEPLNHKSPLCLYLET